MLSFVAFNVEQNRVTMKHFQSYSDEDEEKLTATNRTIFTLFIWSIKDHHTQIWKLLQLSSSASLVYSATKQTIIFNLKNKGDFKL